MALKEIKSVGNFHRQQLFLCFVTLLFLLSVAGLRAEERTVWSNHLAELNQRVPAGFVVVQPPFVVLGDEAPGMVRSCANNPVKGAMKRKGLKLTATPHPALSPAEAERVNRSRVSDGSRFPLRLGVSADKSNPWSSVFIRG